MTILDYAYKFLYLMLAISYTDTTGELDEHT